MLEVFPFVLENEKFSWIGDVRGSTQFGNSLRFVFATYFFACHLLCASVAST